MIKKCNKYYIINFIYKYSHFTSISYTYIDLYLFFGIAYISYLFLFISRYA